jgi:hypothetical protein
VENLLSQQLEHRLEVRHERRDLHDRPVEVQLHMRQAVELVEGRLLHVPYLVSYAKLHRRLYILN